MPAAVDSSFDVAIWFMDWALADNLYMQPMKLQRLLYLAQSYYTVIYPGKCLMSSVFVADLLGPLEPNLYRAFKNGRPETEVRPVDGKVRNNLDSVWRRFGHYTAEDLYTKLCDHPPYSDAYDKAPGEEISLAAMYEFYALQTASLTPDTTTVLPAKIMRSHTGRPVSVKKWMLKPAKKKEKSGQRR